MHGASQTALCERASAVIFSGQATDLDAELVDMSASAVPTYQAAAGEALSLIDAMANVGAAASKGEARRLIKQNAVSANGAKLGDETADLSALAGQAGAVVLSVGKAKRFLIRF